MTMITIKTFINKNRIDNKFFTHFFSHFLIFISLVATGFNSFMLSAQKAKSVSSTVLKKTDSFNRKKGYASTPKPIDICTDPIDSVYHYSSDKEVIEFHVDVNGLSVGKVGFQVNALSDHKIEFRNRFEIDSLIAAFISGEGNAGARLNKNGEILELEHAMNDYVMSERSYKENLVFNKNKISSDRYVNKKNRKTTRNLAIQAIDFVSSFYNARALKTDNKKQCMVIYSNQRAYTLWFKFIGVESVKTPIGKIPSDKFEITYINDRSKKIRKGAIWLSQDELRLPYRSELYDEVNVRAKISSFSN